MQMNITVVIGEGFFVRKNNGMTNTALFSLPFTIRPVKVTVPIQLRCQERETNNFKWGYVDFLSAYLASPCAFSFAPTSECTSLGTQKLGMGKSAKSLSGSENRLVY